MALPPSNPRIGLPSSPAPRSRSLTARVPRQDIPPRPASSASNERPRTRTPPPPLPTVRGRRSLNDLTSPPLPRNPRVLPPPLPDLKHLHAIPPQDAVLEPRRPSEESIASLSSAASSSYSSISSSASSLFSSHPPSSSASSTSSYDDEDDVSKAQPNGVTPNQAVDGPGLSLWNRVAVAAGNLTVSVSKAIETNIVSCVGEETPPGHESRLTRAMKDYHISKARDPSDLPEWLFEARDRGALGQLRIANVTPEDEFRKSIVPPPRAAPAPPVPALPSKPVDVAPPGIMVSRNNSVAPVRRQPSVGTTRSARVRFAEQVHPRQQRAGMENERPPMQRPAQSAKDSFAMTRTAAVPPVPRRNVKLADVNLNGRRPSAQGLPSGVRPQRSRVVV